MKVFDIDQRRLWLSSLIGTTVGTIVVAVDIILQDILLGNGFRLGAGAFAMIFVWLFAFLVVLAITSIVEILASAMRFARNMWTFAISMMIAATLSLPFWPPAWIGRSPQADDLRIWHGVVFAFVTAMGWWFLLPQIRQRARR